MSDPTPNNPKLPPLAWIAPLLLGVMLFLPTLAASGMYDDAMVFRDDDRLRDPSAWGRYFTEAYHPGPDNLYRPAGSLTFALTWWVFGDAWWPQHALNALLHGACSALTTLLAWRLLSRTSAALAAGLLFAAHPLHFEAVAMLVGRFELLCAAATLGGLTLLAWGGPELRAGRGVAIAACGTLALLSKEQGLLFPVLAAVIALATRPLARPGNGAAVMIALLGLNLAAYVVLRENVLDLKLWWERGFLDRNAQPLIAAEGADRWLTPVAVLGRYAQLLVWPHPLSLDYGGPIIGHTWSPRDGYFWLGVGVAAGWVAGIAWATVRRKWVVLALLLAAAVSYAPAANFFTLIGTIFGERLMYLPSAFLLILAAWGLTRLMAWRIALAALLIVSTVQVLRYGLLWREPKRYYQHAVTEQPQSMRLWMLLAEEQRAEGDLSAARASAAEARAADPTSHLPWLWSAIYALEAGDADEARAFALEANERLPGAGLSVLQALEE